MHLDLEVVDDATCRLTLTNLLSAGDAAARNASGWSVCLQELDKLIAGQPGDGPHSAPNQAAFQPLYDAHVAAGLPAGAEIPAPG